MEAVDLDFAREMIWRYADLPADHKARPRPDALPTTMAPKEEDNLLSQNPNDGWWNH